MKNEEQARSLFGISLNERPRWQQFLICCSGFFFGYLVHGICEEYVYNRLQFRLGLHFVDLPARIHHQANGEPRKTYMKLPAVLMGSNGLAKGSLAAVASDLKKDAEHLQEMTPKLLILFFVGDALWHLTVCRLQ